MKKMEKEKGEEEEYKRKEEDIKSYMTRKKRRGEGE